jgi:hypothetical protein
MSQTSKVTPPYTPAGEAGLGRQRPAFALAGGFSFPPDAPTPI